MKHNFTKQDFYDMLIPNGDCLEWSGAIAKTGYGVTRINKKTVKCHRLALELEGINTTGWHVLHSCDNPPCCNPAHLRIGTHYENMKDMLERCSSTNIGKKGSSNILSIIDENDVIAIKERLKNGHRNCDIAIDYGISIQLVTEIKKGRRWKHV